MGHTAVLAALLDGKTLPAGRSTVAKRIYLFPSAGVLSLPALPAASRAVVPQQPPQSAADSGTLGIGIQIPPAGGLDRSVGVGLSDQ